MAPGAAVRALTVSVVLGAVLGRGVHELLALLGAGVPPTPTMFVLLFAGLGVVSVVSDVVPRREQRR